jgi:hypothetical protein
LERLGLRGFEAGAKIAVLGRKLVMVLPARFWISFVLCLTASTVCSAQSAITGRLLQKRGDTRAPLLDCTVFARSIDNGPLVGEYPDGQGRFRLEFPPDSRVTVGTICPDYQIFEINGRSTVPPTHDCSNPGLCAEVDLTLEPLAVIEGHVIDENGMPVEYIRLELRQQAGGQRGRSRQASSDDRGYFRFYHLTPGGYLLRPIVRGGHNEGFAWLGDEQQFTVGAGAVVSAAQVRLRMAAPVELSGRITGLPPGTTSVLISLTSRGETSSHSFGQSVAVDAEGRFRLPGVPPGAYQVKLDMASGADGVLVSNSSHLGAVELGPGSGEIILARTEPGQVKGKLLVEWPDRDDLPREPGQDPVVFQLVSEDGFEQRILAQPPDYTFEAASVHPGTYKIVFYGPGPNVTRRRPDGEWERFEEAIVRKGQTTQLDLRVRYELGRLTVLVKPAPGSPEAAEDKPAAHYVVGFRDERGIGLYPTDQNGRLVMRYFAGGEYEICAWREMSRQLAEDPATWTKAGDAVRKFRHEESADVEITLTAAP